ncbi:MAG: hypothetical protein JSV86_06630 [Gemmatimonadota bacterium]|nr:MAG: hypothetical protein JSV86_06630 [Gemmatimonadota bacterium]
MGSAIRTFLAELKRRKVYRVAVGYVVVAFAVLEGADLVLGPLGGPEWVQTVLAIAALFGFPVAIILAWVLDITPEGIQVTEGTSESRAASTIARRGFIGLVALSLLAAGVIWLLPALKRSATFDFNRVMVFPLVASASPNIERTVGEDVATMIGHALDGTGPLRFIDGWSLLSLEERNDIRELTNEKARLLAGSKSCGYLVIGRVVARGDSADVYLDLRDVAGDSIVARAEAAGAVTQAWQTGLRAVNGLLPILIRTEVPDFGLEFLERDPAAVASFLLGESSYRRARMPEALENYRAAVAADSQFALAAVRGSQAASWSHEPEEAATLVDRALRLELSPRDRYFALGMQAYLDNRADSAVAMLRATLDHDPEMAVAWMQLGEVYHHHLPSDPYPDTLAEHAFMRTNQLDPTATPPLFHLLEILIRKGDVERTQPLMEQFLAADPDSFLAAKVTFMDQCARSGPRSVHWDDWALQRPFQLIAGVARMAVGADRLDCAEWGYRAILLGDTATDGYGIGRQWTALLGLHDVLIARGRAPDAVALYEAAASSTADVRAVARNWATRDEQTMPAAANAARLVEDEAYLWGARVAPFIELLYLRDAALGVDVGERDRFADEYAELRGLEHQARDDSLYMLGVWHASQGNGDVTTRIASAAQAKAAQSEQPETRLLSQALLAHAAAARGDTAEAIERFRSLRPEIAMSLLEWHWWLPMGLERIRLAQLHLARGEFQESIDVASKLDAHPASYVLYVPASLEVRIAAADSLGESRLAERLRERLSEIRAPGAME